MTTKREHLKKKPFTLNSGMLEALLAVQAVSRAPGPSSTILSMVNT